MTNLLTIPTTKVEVLRTQEVGIVTKAIEGHPIVYLVELMDGGAELCTADGIKKAANSN